MRKLIIAATVVVLLAAGIAVLVGDRLTSRFSTEGRRARTLSRLNRSEVLVRRSCGAGEAYVDRGRWHEMGASEQERAADAIAAYCAAQGGGPTLTVLDAETGATLGRWNGTTLERSR